MSETEEGRVQEATRDMEATAEELDERSEQLGDRISETKEDWEQAKGDTNVPTASGDWEDSEPDDPTGDDPSGFDDPEEADLDDEDLGDDEGSGDDEENI